MLVLVRTVTGLERLAAAELAEAHHRVIDVSKRQLVIESTDAIVTSPPRLADDLYLIQAATPDPGPTKPALTAAVAHLLSDGSTFAADLRTRLQSDHHHPPRPRKRQSGPLPGHAPADQGTFVDLAQLLARRGDHVLGGLRARDFAVTASFVGRRNYNRFDIEDLVGEALADHIGGRYHSRRTGVAPPPDRVDWRVTLDGKTLWVGVRPFAVPLHRREWRRRTVTGSLHPPVAAAMARLADLRPGQTVLDPFCGAGTILLEAHAIQPAATYRGTDHNPAAITAARCNGPRLTWHVVDAARLPGPVDRILTNPPWNVRLHIGTFRPYLRAWHRALQPDGRLVAILNSEQAGALINHPTWRIIQTHNLTVAGQHPVIVVAEPNCG